MTLCVLLKLMVLLYIYYIWGRGGEGLCGDSVVGILNIQAVYMSDIILCIILYSLC